MKKLLVAACLAATFSGQALANEEPSLSDKLAPKVEQLAKSTLSWEALNCQLMVKERLKSQS